MFKNVTVPTNSVLPYPQGYGYSPSDDICDLAWFVLILILACRWFASVKRRQREAWLSLFIAIYE